MSETLICERCNGRLHCNREQIDSCFCHSIQLDTSTLELISKVYKHCLCQKCLLELNTKVGTSLKEEHFDSGFLPDIHYYKEKDLFVFTELYHIQKGYCCQNGCRHCPYYLVSEN